MIITDITTEHGNEPHFFYWQVWTDTEGISRQTRVKLTSFQKESMEN